jgi:hypothetical protein
MNIFIFSLIIKALGGFMLVNLVNKQRRAVSVVKTALLGVGITGRSICVHSDSWLDQYGRRENYAVFISAPIGSNTEPYYETGETLLEAVKKMVDSIRGKKNAKSENQSEIAPF